MTLRLPEAPSPQSVDEWLENTVVFSIDTWHVDGQEYQAHRAEAIGVSEHPGAATQSNFERAFFSLQLDDEYEDDYADEDEEYYSYDDDGYVINWDTGRQWSFIFEDDNEQFADAYLRGEVNV